MSIVNFAIPQVLEKRIEKTIKSKGFASRAELFRFAVIQYLDEEENLPFSNDAEMAELSDRLGRVLKEKIGNRKLPSIKQQLKRMKYL